MTLPKTASTPRPDECPTSRKRKQVRKLGRVDIIRREADAARQGGADPLAGSPGPDACAGVARPGGDGAGAHARKDLVGGRRHGRHPGTVGLAGQRGFARVRRAREIPLRSPAMRGDREWTTSCSCCTGSRAELRGGRRGDSRGDRASSTVSRGFIQASAAQLRAFQERALSGEDSEPIGGRQPGGRSGRDPDVASIRGVRGVGTVAEDDELSGVCQCARRGTMRQGGGRTRANDTAGWRPRSWTSNRVYAGSGVTATCPCCVTQ